MARFSREQVEQQLRDELQRVGFSETVARSAAIQGGKHYTDTPNSTFSSALVWAKTYAKPYKRMRDKPVAKVVKAKKPWRVSHG
ncbi:TPA: cell envelope biogenesis protein OmpA [Yersinia enterocolitica]|nr:cell envelope biogenesis protein OmpA [Yersinia enterocolitica]HEN3572118.1 cell envelope biogenesis protein OmpA [Yersinia enterocolitica]HEN3575209.1 cell envelope biogenesis protein OmpA [Yersinia enterocolitica]HEN3651672.1 cell envelope biogenesis protein OmpA [Yersinia enterocolitica]HEN3655090.1 cell envelope biogenesis protein OmpA [Yersinia enterocolitica]